MSERKAIELVGSMGEDRPAAVERAAQIFRDLGVVGANSLTENGKAQAHRAKVKVSFKIEGKDREETRPPTCQA